MTVFDTFAGSTARHGTPSGWGKHRDLGEQPCPACIEAKRVYDQAWRSAPDRVRKNRLHAKAQNRANTRLANIYRDVYRVLYQEELDKALAEAGEVR